MKCSVAHTSYIIKFLDINFNANEISDRLEYEFNSLLEGVGDSRVLNWSIQFRLHYDRGEKILISTRLPSYKDLQYKKVTIILPIPDDNTVSWGVRREQYIVRAMPDPAKFICLDLDFDYNNVSDYIEALARRAIFYRTQARILG